MSTNREKLEAFRKGERVVSKHTLTSFPLTPDKCTHKGYRVVLCVDERDILECSECGYQKEAACDFDDEYFIAA